MHHRKEQELWKTELLLCVPSLLTVTGNKPKSLGSAQLNAAKPAEIHQTSTWQGRLEAKNNHGLTNRV